jgi:hypothetical protein
MKPRILLTLLAIILCTDFSYAAFPKYTNNETSIEATHIATTTTADTIKKKQMMEEDVESDEIDSEVVREHKKSGTLGTVSFIVSFLALASAIGGIALLFTTPASLAILPLLVIAEMTGVGAIITGAIAAKTGRNSRGGRVGLTIGIISVAATVAAALAYGILIGAGIIVL